MINNNRDNLSYLYGTDKQNIPNIKTFTNSFKILT